MRSSEADYLNQKVLREKIQIKYSGRITAESFINPMV